MVWNFGLNWIKMQLHRPVKNDTIEWNREGIMKRSKMKKALLGGLLLACAGALCGCGEEPYELQNNERAIIVNYAAHIVAKYNMKQPEGYRYVYTPEDDQQEEPAEDTAGQDTTDTTSSDTQSPDTAATDSNTPQDSGTTLSEALGLNKIQAVYTGAELTDRYDETVVPESGRQLLILHVTLQNPTKKTQKCDILSLLPTFRVKVNGNVEATSELTILPDNLATWEEDLPAGASENTVIIFQLNKDAVTQIDQLEMEVKTEEKTSRVLFL